MFRSCFAKQKHQKAYTANKQQIAMYKETDWQSEGDRFESDMLHNLMVNNKKGIHF